MTTDRLDAAATTRLTDEQLRSYARGVDYPDRCMATELLTLRRDLLAALAAAEARVAETPETVERVARAMLLAADPEAEPETDDNLGWWRVQATVVLAALRQGT